MNHKGLPGVRFAAILHSTADKRGPSIPRKQVLNQLYPGVSEG